MTCRGDCKDTAGHAGRLKDALKARFQGGVFMDIEKIAPGRDFVKAIDEAVGNCSVLLVLIGDQWLSLTDGQTTTGNRPALALAAGGALLLAAVLVGWYFLSGRENRVSPTGAPSGATVAQPSAADLKEKEEINQALQLTGGCIAAAEDMLEKLTNPDYDPSKFMKDKKRVETVERELEAATDKYNEANDSWEREKPRLELLMGRHPVVDASWRRAQKTVTDYMQCVRDLNEEKSNGKEPPDPSKVCQREKRNAEEDVTLLTASLKAAAARPNGAR